MESPNFNVRMSKSYKFIQYINTKNYRPEGNEITKAI